MNRIAVPAATCSAHAGHGHPTRWLRRARPLLGTLVEVGLDAAGFEAVDDGAATDASQAAFAVKAFEATYAVHAFEAAFAAVTAVQACLSRFEPGSDIGRFNAAAAGTCLDVQPDTVVVLRLAQQLFDDTGGGFDVAQGSGRWSLCGHALVKHDAGTRIDLGGIGKGHAVDRAVAALCASGARHGWVNAGGDLRVFGAAELPLKLRNEHGGGVTDFGWLHDGAFATSCFDAPGHARLARPAPGHANGSAPSHASVQAPTCMLADALTKIVALSGNAMHPLLARHGAQAWLHPHAHRLAA